MTKEEYISKLQEISNQFEKDKKALARQYALSNNPYKVDDIISDHIGSIKITNINWAFPGFDRLPECTYSGRELKKDKTPTKKESYRTIWGQNIKQ